MAVEHITPRSTPSRHDGDSASRAPFDQAWVPSGYRGPVALPGTGRMVWWTGRIAIGLRYAPGRSH